MKSWIAITLLTLSASIASFEPLPQQKVYLELGDTKVTENDKPVIEVGGKCGAGEVLAFHLPQKGWFVVSVEPFDGYDFQKIASLNDNRITFKVDDRRYEIISDRPISSGSHPLDLWVVRITPPADRAHAASKMISCSTDFKYWLKTTLLRDAKELP